MNVYEFFLKECYVGITSLPIMDCSPESRTIPQPMFFFFYLKKICKDKVPKILLLPTLEKYANIKMI